MSDRKHMEYCIQLGNPFIQSKLDKLENLEYNSNISIPVNYNETTKIENVSFRERLRNWNS